MESLRRKSVVLTGYLHWLLEQQGGEAGPGDHSRRFRLPRQPAVAGVLRETAGALRAALETAGVVLDFRPPDVLRAAPVPL